MRIIRIKIKSVQAANPRLILSDINLFIQFQHLLDVFPCIAEAGYFVLPT